MCRLFTKGTLLFLSPWTACPGEIKTTERQGSYYSADILARYNGLLWQIVFYYWLPCCLTSIIFPGLNLSMDQWVNVSTGLFSNKYLKVTNTNWNILGMKWVGTLYKAITIKAMNGKKSPAQRICIQYYFYPLSVV